MELGWLEDFLTLAEHGHFSNAAELRNISQPAFSRRIKLLEEWVGAPLFVRNTYSVDLTSAGDAFRIRAADIVRSIQEARQDAREVAGVSESTIRFATTIHLSLSFFPHWLQQIEAIDPNIAPVSLISDTSGGCQRLLSDGLVDFMLCFYHPFLRPPLEASSFEWVDIGSDRLIPVSAPRTQGSSTALHELPGSPNAPVAHLSFRSQGGIGAITTGSLLSTPSPIWLRPAFTAQMATVLVAMAKAGRGVAWLPETLVKEDLDQGALLSAGADWDIPITIRLTRPRGAQRPTIEAFWRAALAAGTTWVAPATAQPA